MKKFEQILKRLYIQLICAIVFLLFNAGSCDSQTDNRPSITSVYPEKWDIELDPVFLRYDLLKFVDDCQRYGNTYPASDIQELADYNNVYLASSWLNFNSLFYNTNNYSGSGPEARFVFYLPDCKDQIIVKYNRFDDKLCNQNTITNAPKIKKTHSVDFSAHTIKTSQNGICIKWKKTSVVTGVGSYINLDLKGTVDYPTYLFSTGTKGGNQAAVRIVDNKFILVENTLSQEVAIGDYTPTIVDETPVVSDLLRKNVCIAGNMDVDVKWSVPFIVKLETM